MKRLPIGIQELGEIIDGGYIYVDKTEYLYRLMNIGKYLFFARPRRFGKSLTVSTLHEIFIGNKRLFQGLWIEDKIDWLPRPVIRIDLNAIAYSKQPLATALDKRVSEIADSYDIDLKNSSDAKEKLTSLLAELAKRGRKAVVLIDEYDKPITDYLDEPEKLKEIIPVLKQFYSVLKSSDANIHFVFITGVSKFGKVSIFSDLNNLNDVSIHEATLTLCGYTQPELEYNFAEYIDNAATSLAVTREQVLAGIKHWYNGYGWDGNPENSVYNPFSLLNFFDKPEFKGYWFETGTPTFLTKLIKEAKITTYQLEKMNTGALSLSAADINHISVLGMLFQTGYLTVLAKKNSTTGTRYTLGYPNEEVRQAFSKCLLAEYLDAAANDLDGLLIPPMTDALESYDFEEFFKYVKSVFSSIPYNITDSKEAYFHSIMHVLLTTTGWRVFSEVATNRGRMDTVLENEDTVYIFEFKVGESANAALAQIRENGYAERYAKADKKLLLIGVSYSTRSRNIKEWKIVQ